MHREIAGLYYLTQDLPHSTHEQQVRVACSAGVKWVQLRVKNKEFSEWLAIAERVKAITSAFDATLIINDHVEIAKLVDADGVHLGQDDMDPNEARKNLGTEKIIGLSTHSLQEMIMAKGAPIDYFGLGPFQFTTTKETLNPVLGTKGVQEIIRHARDAGITQPVIAIGGIQLNNVPELIHAGANGVAISSAINLSGNPGEVIATLLSQLETFLNRDAFGTITKHQTI